MILTPDYAVETLDSSSLMGAAGGGGLVFFLDLKLEADMSMVTLFGLAGGIGA